MIALLAGVRVARGEPATAVRSLLKQCDQRSLVTRSVTAWIDSVAAGTPFDGDAIQGFSNVEVALARRSTEALAAALGR